MTIYKSGTKHNAGIKKLASKDVSQRTVIWNNNTGEGVVVLHGSDGRSNYNYRIAISTDEVLNFLNSAARSCTAGPASKAVALGSIATLREIFKNGLARKSPVSTNSGSTPR